MEKSILLQSRILVVEGDSLQGSVLKAALATDGHEFDTCSNGLDAVWKVGEGHYDLVLLDYQLSEIDGLATVRLIGDVIGDTARPRVVALTALPDSVIGREMLAERALDEVVSKSLDLPELLATVSRHLRSAAAGAVRQATKFDLLTKESDEFDGAPGGLRRPTANRPRPPVSSWSRTMKCSATP